MTRPHAVGIDLGTTYSAVAQIDETGRTAMIRNAQGDILTPSVVLFEDREIVVGKEAKKMAGIQPGHVAQWVKREMGQPTFSQPIRGEFLPPEVIQSCILHQLKQDATAVLGPDFQTVITVPAYFDEPRRKATADAGEMAGLTVLDIVNEPTAAALAFGEQLGYLDPRGAPRDSRRLLVYDLGGGTFDVTIVELRPGELRTLATDGDAQLGGHDWDSRLANYVASVLTQGGLPDPRTDLSAMARLLRAVEEAKHTLSARDQAVVHFELAGQGRDVPVSRAKFAELCEDLLERTRYTTSQVLATTGLQWSDIGHVLMVGGSTRMPLVAEMLERLSGIRPEHQTYPDEAVARGAAIFAGYRLASQEEANSGAKFQVTDVNSHSLGIEGIDQRTGEMRNAILIPRNTPLPHRAAHKFVTKEPSQKSVIVQVLEGEGQLPKHCTPIGRAVLRQLPGDLPQGTRIDVTYEYGTNGRLSVRARLPSIDRELQIELERASGLSNENRTRWKQLFAGEPDFSQVEVLLRETFPAARTERADVSAAPVARNILTSTGKISADIFTDEISAADLATAENSRPLSATRVVSVAVEHAVQAESAATPMGLVQSAGPQANLVQSHVEPLVVSAVFADPTSVNPADMEPMAASSKRGDAGAARRKRARRRLMINLGGHVVAAAGGLLIGYYILCIISPELNFLHLSLPGLAAPPPVEVPAASP